MRSMSPLALSCVIFLLVLGGIFIGTVFRRALPKNHLSKETQGVVRLGAGLTATIAALVLGLLIGGAKGSFDTRSSQVKQLTVMAHADETDDSHNASRSHPGCAVVPAALAAGEQFGIDGARFLRAVTLGYDIGTRVVLAMGGFEFSYESSLATHSIAGTFGTAAAAACAAGLDTREMRWALDYTAQQSSGIAAWRRDTDHIEKAFVFGGMPARNGATSALLVRLGWNGVDDIFTGADNFFQSYAPKAQRARLIEKLGERYEISLTDIKKWTVGSPTRRGRGDPR
jgi:2-methylcitrate dehydratase PrpD